MFDPSLLRRGIVKRRDFLQRSAVTAGALVWPQRLAALADELTLRRHSNPWDVVRAAFMIPEDRIYLNVGTLGPQPRVVVDAVVEHTQRVAMTFPPAIDWAALKNRIGALLNGDPDGFAFPRNTTEAMSFVANGLELDAGDEVDRVVGDDDVLADHRGEGAVVDLVGDRGGDHGHLDDLELLRRGAVVL